MTDDYSAQDLLAAYGLSVDDQSDEHRGVLVVVEAPAGEVSDASWRAVGAGRDIADVFGARLEALVLGDGSEAAAGAISRGADAALTCDSPATYALEGWAAPLLSAVEGRRPEVVVLGGTDAARELAPWVAERLDTGLIAGAVSLRPEADERLVVGIVPMYEGRLLGEYACPERRPQMICLAADGGRLPAEERGREGEIIAL